MIVILLIILEIIGYNTLCIKLSDTHFQSSALFVPSMHFCSICHCASFTNDGTWSFVDMLSSMESQGFIARSDARIAFDNNYNNY